MCLLTSRKYLSGGKSPFVLQLCIQGHLHVDPYSVLRLIIEILTDWQVSSLLTRLEFCLVLFRLRFLLYWKSAEND